MVVPVYNRQDVVRRAVDSLLAQRFDQPYEIVVVDDGSTDGSADRVQGLSPNITVVRQPNAGAAAARRAGIEAARGRYVAFLDSDDVAEPWHLAEHWQALHRRRDVVLSFARVTDLSGNPSGRRNLTELLAPDHDGVIGDPLAASIRHGCLTASMNLLTYRDVALKAAARRYDVPASNDYAFALQAARQGAFAYIDRCTIRCDRRDDGIGRRHKAEQFAFALLATHRAVADSGRTDKALWDSLSRRLADAWPAAVIVCVRDGHRRLAARVLALGLRHGLRGDAFRRLWWALSEESR